MRPGRIPVELHATLPGGEPMHIGTFHLDLTITQQGGLTGTGPVYGVKVDLEETFKTIRQIFEIENERDETP